MVSFQVPRFHTFWGQEVAQHKPPELAQVPCAIAREPDEQIRLGRSGIRPGHSDPVALLHTALRADEDVEHEGHLGLQSEAFAVFSGSLRPNPDQVPRANGSKATGQVSNQETIRPRIAVTKGLSLQVWRHLPSTSKADDLAVPSFMSHARLAGQRGGPGSSLGHQGRQERPEVPQFGAGERGLRVPRPVSFQAHYDPGEDAGNREGRPIRPSRALEVLRNRRQSHQRHAESRRASPSER